MFLSSFALLPYLIPFLPFIHELIPKRVIIQAWELLELLNFSERSY
jgi:hypothetical protein